MGDTGKGGQLAMLWSFSMVSVTPFWVMGGKCLANTKENQFNLVLKFFLVIVIPNGIKTTPPGFSVALKVFKKIPGHFTSMRSNINNIYED